jgi:hypothetical protein
MELRDPVVGYKPASQREAQLVLIALADAGIDASIIEDTSQVGLWSDDRDALQSRPQIWIERDDVARAALAPNFEIRRGNPRQSKSHANPAGSSRPFPANVGGPSRTVPTATPMSTWV